MFKRFLQGGNPFLVDIQKQGTGYYCVLSEEGKQDLPLNVEAFTLLEDHHFQLQIGRHTHHGQYHVVDGRYFLHLNGRTLEIKEAGHDSDGAGGSGVHRSPMPGKVLDVRVQVGDRVEQDQGLLVVEAMKMENVIKANLAGVVRELHCRAGDTISPDDLLVVIE